VKLVLVTLFFAVLLGLVLGGRWSNLARVHIRWPVAALVGLGLQLAPVPGRGWAMAMLAVSFALLIAFAMVNLHAHVPGSAPILVGMVLNLLVISVNGGMPVTRQALVASGQLDTLHELVRDGGAKHHLAGPSDRLLVLGDAIAIGPLEQAVSLGDLFVYGGVVWLIVAGMLGREIAPRPAVEEPTGIGRPSGVV
jgi:hypothetical protein